MASLEMYREELATEFVLPQAGDSQVGGTLQRKLAVDGTLPRPDAPGGYAWAPGQHVGVYDPRQRRKTTEESEVEELRRWLEGPMGGVGGLELTPGLLERKRSSLKKTELVSPSKKPAGAPSFVSPREQVDLRPTPVVEKRQITTENKLPTRVELKAVRRKGTAAGDLWAGKYDFGKASPEDMKQQLNLLQKNEGAMRALRDAMLLEGKVTKSEDKK